MYLVVGWAIVEAASVLFPALLLPDWTHRLVVVLTLLGFPAAVILAWAFDVTPDGLRKTDEADVATPTTAEKADELARVGHRKLDIAALRRRVGREMMGLGARVNELLEQDEVPDVREDEDVQRFMQRIRDLRTQIEHKEKEVEDIRRKTGEESPEDDDLDVMDADILDEEETPRTD